MAVFIFAMLAPVGAICFLAGNGVPGWAPCKLKSADLSERRACELTPSIPKPIPIHSYHTAIFPPGFSRYSIFPLGFSQEEKWNNG